MSTQEEIMQRAASSEALMGKRVPWIHILGTVAVFAVILVVAGSFYIRTFEGLVTPNSMDMAQIARNIVQGNGFTTCFVRPFNVPFFHDEFRFYPELNHGPVFPYAIATFFKIRSVSEQVTVWTSLLFMLLTAGATYILGRLLFDWRAGLLAASVFALSLPVLKAATAGEEWTLIAFLFTLLLCAMALHHRSTERRSTVAGMLYGALSAILLAALYMTNHVLVFLVIPMAVYFAVTGPARKLHLIIFLLVCILAVSPWAIRNGLATGSPVLGLTGWDLMSNTSAFPNDALSRSTDEGSHSLRKLLLFPLEQFPSFTDKLAKGSGEATGAALVMLGWLVVPVALVSMLYRFRSSSANAVRGFVYGALPLMVACFALFSVGGKAMVMFAPIAAVMGSAYFLLLLDAKKLHPFFAKSLVGGLLFLTAYPALVAGFWKDNKPLPPGAAMADRLFSYSRFMRIAALTPIYTDVPWVVAWRANGVGVWLPRSDTDIIEVNLRGLPMNIIVLTSEADNYSTDEVWYVLHRVRLWREYVKDPKEGVRQIVEAAGLQGETARDASKTLDRFSRKFRVSDTIKGFAAQREDPLSPDDLQILVRKEAQ